MKWKTCQLLYRGKRYLPLNKACLQHTNCLNVPFFWFRLLCYNKINVKRQHSCFNFSSILTKALNISCDATHIMYNINAFLISVSNVFLKINTVTLGMLLSFILTLSVSQLRSQEGVLRCFQLFPRFLVLVVDYKI